MVGKAWNGAGEDRAEAVVRYERVVDFRMVSSESDIAGGVGRLLEAVLIMARKRTILAYLMTKCSKVSRIPKGNSLVK